MLIRLMTEQHQRHHFQSRERSTGCHNRRGCACEIQVVERTGHAADQEQAAGHQRSGGCRFIAHQAQVVEHKRQGGCGEHFKEAFYPQMHHPPTPVFHHRNRAVFTVEQAGRIERTHAHNRSHENRQQVFVAALFERRHGAAQHQEQPQQEAHCEQHLPEATQIQVFIALVAKPEIG